MSLRIDVALAGGTPIVRAGLQRILGEHGFPVLCSAARVADVAVADRREPWILLLLADSDGADTEADVLAGLHDRFPAARTVLLASQFDFAQVRRAFTAGVFGCLVDEIACDRLIGMLQLVALGEKVFPSQLADELVDRLAVSQHRHGAASVLSANLSTREVEILRCLTMGLPNKIISRRLSISEATVKVHVKAVLRKLRVMNRTQAAIWASSQGLGGLDWSEPPSRPAIPLSLPTPGFEPAAMPASRGPLQTV